MPGTGTIAVSQALVKKGAVLLGGHHDTPERHIDYLQTLNYDHTWTTVTTVRPVADWFRSMFCKGVCGACNIIDMEWVREFEKDQWYFPYGVRTPFWRYTPFSNVILDQRDLQNQLNCVFNRLGAPNVQLERLNYARVKAEWDKKAFDYIIKTYGDDDGFISRKYDGYRTLGYIR